MMHDDLKFRRYLGDGVYAGFDGYHIILWLEGGGSRTNTIALDPAVFSALLKFSKVLPLLIADEKKKEAKDEG